MVSRSDLEKQVNSYFSGQYTIINGTKIPEVADVPFGKTGKEMELAMLFIDIRESTKIVDGFRRRTAARMYKSFLWGVSKIARDNNGQLRSFNGDGVLVVFSGENKRTNAVKAALQMTWFCRKILKPKVEEFFENNKQLEDLNFDFGIGVDVGKVLVVRGGIKGGNNNDLVWVGNATNYSVKFSSFSIDGYNTYISEDVYKKMADSSKFDDNGNDMWVAIIRNDLGGITAYKSKYEWFIS